MIEKLHTKKGKVLKFPRVDVLEQGIEQVKLALQLKRDFFIENLGRETIEIYFVDITGLNRVKTNIWTPTEKALIIKQSKLIPLANIVAVA